MSAPTPPPGHQPAQISESTMAAHTPSTQITNGIFGIVNLHKWK